MEANYVGPGWYWVEDVEQPLSVEMGADGNLWASLNHIRFILGHTAINIAHIPRPAQRPVVDWSVMPAWAKYIAQDECGDWWWSENKPEARNSVWLHDGGMDGTIPLSYRPKYTGDWRNSLVERPE